MISLVDRVKLNYALCTITNIVFYTLILSQLSALSGYFEKLWMHVIYFTFSEILKLVIIQKMYGLDTSYNQEGVKRRRGNKVGESVKFAVLMLLTVISFAFICVIMGAPPLEKYEETFTLSGLLAALTLFPVSIFIGVSATLGILFTETFELINVTSQAYLKLLKRNAYLVIFGAFVGSAVFPLDWDRPWQIYPIPNVVGAITGQLFGCFFCIVESMIKNKLAKKQR